MGVCVCVCACVCVGVCRSVGEVYFVGWVCLCVFCVGLCVGLLNISKPKGMGSFLYQ